MHMSKYRHNSSQSILILTSALSKVSLEILKTSDAFGTNTDVGMLELLIPRYTPSEMP